MTIKGSGAVHGKMLLGSIILKKKLGTLKAASCVTVELTSYICIHFKLHKKACKWNGMATVQYCTWIA